MHNAFNINSLLLMSSVLKGDVTDNMTKKGHCNDNFSTEAEGDDPMGGGGEGEGAGDAMDFGGGLDDIDSGLDDMGGDPMGGGDEEGGGDFGDDSGDSGGGSGGGFSGGGGGSGFNPIDQEKKDVQFSPHYVQDRRKILYELYNKLLEAVSDSREKLLSSEGVISNKPIIDALEELENDITSIIEIINKESHDILMLRLTECRAIYNNIIEKV